MKIEVSEKNDDKRVIFLLYLFNMRVSAITGINLQDQERIKVTRRRQIPRAFVVLMQVHKKRSI